MVAKHGGFSAAAKVLNVSQSALSTQVKALESRYDVELFNRARREVTLTFAGKDLYEVTIRLFQVEEEAENLLLAFKGLQHGTLRIAAVGPFHATDMIVAFKSAYPDIDVTVQFGNSQHCFERLLAYDVDVALIAEVNPDERVRTIPYSTHDVVVFVSREHPFSAHESISIKELQGAKVVQRELGSTTRSAIEAALRKHKIKIDPVMDIGSREGIWKAVEQGLGIGFVADFEFVAHPNLKAIPIHDAEVRTQYFLAFLEERKQSRLIRAFHDL
ncbi:MAG: LysR family transcriptional regulator, partial [Rhizobiaceae bacterium]|nr:LysR family transcriptional regulator [Rhizobiaceae bacterium]